MEKHTIIWINHHLINLLFYGKIMHRTQIYENISRLGGESCE